MDIKTREETIQNIVNIQQEYESSTRLSRLLHDPIRTSLYYILQVVARIYPIPVTHKTLWGDFMQYYLPEGNQIYYYGFYEANLSNFLIRFLKDGDVLIDIGANIGFYSMLGSALVNNGKVIAFEPTLRTFSTLKKNAHNRKNISAVNVALSNTEDTVTIIDYGRRLSAFNTINPRTVGKIGKLLKGGKEISIASTTLDKYLADNPLDNISFIKIDAEGHESKILSGASLLLKNQRPIFSLEVGQDIEWKNNVKLALKILKDNQYISYEALINGYLKRRDFDEQISSNLIFVPAEKISKVKDYIV